MTLNQFLVTYKIQPADAIVVKKEAFGILDHYVIYLGRDQKGEHKFIANYSKGIQFLSIAELTDFLKSYIPVRLNRFLGSKDQRVIAVRRALSRLNEQSYNLILNNCEHFSNWVQKGISSSDQVKDLSKALITTGTGLGLVGITNKDDRLAIVGLFASALGLIIAGLEDK